MTVELVGNFARIRIRDPRVCDGRSFRTDDIGRSGHSLRVACRRASDGQWVTQAILVPRDEVALRLGRLVGLTPQAKRTLAKIRQQYGSEVTEA